MDPKKRALGRGLDALLPVAPTATHYGDKSVFTCALEKIVPQKGQPRQHFDPQKLDEIDAVFVTVEPNGGSPNPSGKPFLFAYLKVNPNHP